MLKEKIQNDLTKAMKEGDETTRSVLRVLLASVQGKEKEKRYKISKIEKGASDEELGKKSQLNDEEIIDVIVSEVKKRNEASLLFEKGNRKDLADNEKAEMVILKKYLPEQMSEEELKKIVQEAVKKTGAAQIKDMGKVMAEVVPQTKGKADGAQISKLVKEILTK